MTFLKLAATACFALAPLKCHNPCTIERSTQLYSSSTSSTTSTPKKYENLLAWLENEGAVFDYPIEIRESQLGGGYGAVVVDDAKEGDLLFSIPRTACVTMDNIKADEACGKAFEKLIEKAGPGGNTVCLAGFLSKEYLKMLHDDEAEQESKALFAPYLATLPWARGINNQEHTLYWSDEDIESYLGGSLCYNEAKDLRDEVCGLLLRLS